MMVRSAVKLVSNTRAKPNRRKRGRVMAPITSAPGGRPNSSPRVTETAGACCTTTICSGSFRASNTSFTWLCSASAPVGQAVMHCPQLTQLDTLSPSSNAVPTLAREPRPMKSMAPDALDLFAHSNTLAAEDALGRIADDRRARSVQAVPGPFARETPLAETPNSSANCWSWQLPLRVQ